MSNPNNTTISNPIDYKIIKTLYGVTNKAELKVQKSIANSISIGDVVDIYLYGSKVMRGIVRYKADKKGYVELIIYGEGDAFQKRYVRRKLYPSDVGESGTMDIAKVVEWIVSNYSSFSYVYGDTIVETGYRVSKVVMSDKVYSILNNFADAVGFIWYVKDGVFYFKEAEYEASSLTIDNSNARFEKWDIITDKLANDVHVFGADLTYNTSDFFAGDGTKTVFKLSYIPSSVRVFVEGTELDRDEYSLNLDTQEITLNDPPPNKPTGVTSYSGWTWRRKITVTNSSGSNKSNPVVFIKLNEDNFDFESAQSDLGDVRFGKLDGTEFPHVYLGVDENYDRVFAVKLSGVTIANGGSYEFYMFYGNSEVDDAEYSKSDVLGVVDEFNYDGELDNTKWTITTYVVGVTDYEMYYRSYISNHMAKIYAKVIQWYGQSVQGQLEVEVTPKDNHSLYVYYYNTGSDSDKHIGLNIVTDKPLFDVGEHNNFGGVTEYTDGTMVILDYGMYYADTYFIDSAVSVGSRELHSNYNVEVRYSFIVPIYANMKDSESIEEHDVMSVELRLSWIRDFKTAVLVASKYLANYSEFLYNGRATMAAKYVLDNGYDVGKIVYVSDSISNISKPLLIRKIKFEKGFAYVDIGDIMIDIYRWGAMVEHRVRQLETEGDENFFTPSWMK